MALKTKGHFKIGSAEFAAQNIKASFESLAGEDSGRTADGVMHISWIFSKIRKISITLPPSTGEEISQILSLVQGKQYQLTYFDVLDNAEKTIEVYTSASSADMYNGVLYNGLWQGATFNAIEVAGEK